MTKGERKKAIALALAKIEATGKICDEAYEALKAIEKNYFNGKATHYEVYCAEQRAEECKTAYFRAKDEYNELIKYKAWKSVMKA